MRRCPTPRTEAGLLLALRMRASARPQPRASRRLVLVQSTSEGSLAQDECSAAEGGVAISRRPAGGTRCNPAVSSGRLTAHYLHGMRAPFLDVAGGIAHLLGRRRADQHVQAERRQLTPAGELQRGPVRGQVLRAGVLALD